MANDTQPNEESQSMQNDNQAILAGLFTKLKELGSGNEISKLFPSGIESVHFEVSVSGENAGSRFVLKITGATAAHLDQVGNSGKETALNEDFHLLFNAEGHHVIAYIAQKDLQENSPEIWDKVEKILTDGDRELPEAAVYPDAIRMQQPATKVYHFVDIPFEDNGPANPPLPEPPHVLSKIDEYTEILKAGNEDGDGMVNALSWLIHLFGDVHQPLHCIEHISELHPAGDRGGNSFKLKGKPNNLHSAWDSSVNVLNPGKDEEALATEIGQLHSRADLAKDLKVPDTEKWARSSFKLAKENAYSIEENPQSLPKLSAAYLKNMEAIGQRQAALAGYRLADRLKEIFG